MIGWWRLKPKETCELERIVLDTEVEIYLIRLRSLQSFSPDIRIPNANYYGLVPQENKCGDCKHLYFMGLKYYCVNKPVILDYFQKQMEEK